MDTELGSKVYMLSLVVGKQVMCCSRDLVFAYVVIAIGYYKDVGILVDSFLKIFT
jgi:hypothetical protein